jgi:phosphoribosylformylglycinamidine synthase subunit PurS
MHIRRSYAELGVVSMFKATVYVTLRESVLDPQGNAVHESLHSLGYDEVGDVRIGKYMELEIDSNDQKAAEKRVRDMCEKLLANTVIEDFRFDLNKLEG